MALTKVTYSMINGAPVNVKDFGAVGDGTTDNTLAIQAAIDACVDGQTLYFPTGNYLVSGILTSTNTINYVGEGIGSAIFQSTDNDLLVIANQREINIKGLALYSAATTSTKSIIRLTNVMSSYIDVFMLGGYSGLTLAGCILNSVRVHCSTNSNSQVYPGWTLPVMQRGINMTGANAIATNANTFINCVLEGIIYGIYSDANLVGETDNQFIGGTSENNGYGIFYKGSYQPTTINGMHFEDNQFGDIILENSFNVAIENCYLGFNNGQDNIKLISCNNICVTNCYVYRLSADAPCINIKTRECVVRRLFDNSADSDLVNYQYLDFTGSPYGGSDAGQFGRFEGLAQKLINTNTNLKVWTSPSIPDGFTNVGFATISQDTSIVRSGTFSTKIVPPYAPNAFAGMSFQIPVQYANQLVTMEIWAYRPTGAEVSISIFTAGIYIIFSNIAEENHWRRYVSTFRVPEVGSYGALVMASLSSASALPIYLDSFKVYALE